MRNTSDLLSEFHSIVDGVDNIQTVNELLREAIQYQYMFETRKLPSESHDLLEDDLQNFSIDLNKISRLYYILHHDDNASCRKYELLARMEHNYENVFVKLSAGYEFTRFGCLGGGVIYVTKNVNLFFNIMVEEHNNKMKICQSLQEDGFSVNESHSSRTPNENKCRLIEFLSNSCDGNMSNDCHQDHYSDNYPRVQHPQYAEIQYS